MAVAPLTKTKKVINYLDTVDLNNKLTILLNGAIHHLPKQDSMAPCVFWAEWNNKFKRPLEVVWNFHPTFSTMKELNAFAHQVYTNVEHFEQYLKAHLDDVSWRVSDCLYYAIIYIDWKLPDRPKQDVSDSLSQMSIQ